jgi:penicillin-binding protein 1B
MIYLWVLYGQLTEAFNKPSQFIPTRFYSDISRIAAPHHRAQIVERLKALAYNYQDTGEEIRFKLHPVDYPTYLLPDGHAVAGAVSGESPVVIRMTGKEREAPLQSIELDGHEIPDLYLEPELVATLSRGGSASDRQIRDVVKFEQVPAPIWKAIIAVEDPRFLEHVGLDPRGLLRAIWVDVRTRSLAQGGSTITLQLVKNLTARRGRNVVRKVNEIFLALLLEATFEKEQILERYLNEVYLGQVGAFEIHGVAEGARHFFGKPLEELSLAEIAFMAGIIRGPAYYSPYSHKERAIERQRFVLKRMVENGAIVEAEAKEASRETLRFAPPQTTTNKAPYFADYVKAELIRNLKDKIAENDIPEASLKVYTTLDMRLSTQAQRAVAEGVARLEKSMKIPPESRGLEGALATVDHNSGYVRALVGGKSYAKSTFNRILNMKRQVGSTFKPFVYLTAFAKGYDAGGVPYAPGHPVEDAPWTLVYDSGRQKWTPKNYEKEFLGWTDYRRALAHSVNTVASKVGHEVGIPRVIETAKSLGITSPLPNVPSLALGVAELSPIELLKAYAVLADHGVQDELTVIRAITQDDGSAFMRFVYNPKQIAERGPVDLLTHMMQSVFTEGTARAAAAMGFEHQAAGKTGTTSNHRDAWFAGYTPQLTTVVWVGADQTPAEEALEAEKLREKNKGKKKKEKEVKLSGAGAALPIWAQFMNEALRGESPAQFDLAADLVDVPIDRHTGRRAEFGCAFDQVVTEKFAKGFEPKDSSCTPDWPPSAPQSE